MTSPKVEGKKVCNNDKCPQCFDSCLDGWLVGWLAGWLASVCVCVCRPVLCTVCSFRFQIASRLSAFLQAAHIICFSRMCCLLRLEVSYGCRWWCCFLSCSTTIVCCFVSLSLHMNTCVRACVYVFMCVSLWVLTVVLCLTIHKHHRLSFSCYCTFSLFWVCRAVHFPSLTVVLFGFSSTINLRLSNVCFISCGIYSRNPNALSALSFGGAWNYIDSIGSSFYQFKHWN